MQMHPDFFEVTKTEIHAVRVCPCTACEAERARRGIPIASSDHSSVQRFSVSQAQILGFVKTRSPYGSKAREFSHRQRGG